MSFIKFIKPAVETRVRNLGAKGKSPFADENYEIKYPVGHVMECADPTAHRWIKRGLAIRTDSAGDKIAREEEVAHVPSMSLMPPMPPKAHAPMPR